MRTLFVLMVVTSVVHAQPPGLTDPDAALAPPGMVAPIQEDEMIPGEPSYWYQTALLDVGVIAAMSLTFEAESEELLIATLALYGLGGPIVHAAHGHRGRAVGSLVLRAGLPIIGGYALAEVSEDGLEGFLIGFAVGMGTAMIIDSAVLARGTPAKRRVAPTVTPLAGGASVGVTGSF